MEFESLDADTWADDIIPVIYSPSSSPQHSLSSLIDTMTTKTRSQSRKTNADDREKKNKSSGK